MMGQRGAIAAFAATLLCFVDLSIAADSAKSPDIDVKVETYVDPQGVQYFGLGLKAKPAKTLAAVDLLVWVDLSAGQTGPRRAAAVDLVDRIANQLVGGSRVQIGLTSKLKSPLMLAPAAVGSESLSKALRTLNAEVPGGANQFADVFKATESWLHDVDAGLPKAVLYVGNGRAGLDNSAVDLRLDFARKLRAANAPFYAVSLRGSLEPGMVKPLVDFTGGRWIAAFGPAKDTKVDANRPVQLALEVVRAVSEAPVHVTALRFSNEVVSRSPQQLPLVRSDSDSALVGVWKANETVDLEIEGNRGEETLKTRHHIKLPKADANNAYLKELATSGLKETSTPPPAAPASHSLTQLRLSSARLVEGLLAQAKGALAANDVGLARDLYVRAARIEPNNLEAKTGLKATENAPDKVVLQPANQTGEFANAKLADTGKPAGDNDADAIQKFRTLEKIEAQRLQRAVTDALREAQKLSRTNLDDAISLLKQTLATVQAAADSGAAAQINLAQKIESQLRLFWRQRQKFELERASRDKVAAQIDAARRQERAETVRQETTRALMQRFQGLYDSGAYSEAEAVAEMILNNEPDSAVALASAEHAKLARHYVGSEQLENTRKEQWWRTLHDVEDSAMPFPDNTPIVYPSAKVWEELTIKRQKYKAVDLSPVTPAEESIRRALTRPISVNFDETPLSEVIQFLQDFANVNIVLDPKGLQEVNVQADAPVTVHLESLTLKSVLNLILDPLDLTYMIKDEVLFITSKANAQKELVTRVYPVADLVIPIVDLGQGGIGLGGGLGGGGGQGGGLGGGGGGGLGGGGLGGGARGGAGGLGGGAGGQGGGQGAGNSGDYTQDFIDLIRSVIEPESWQPEGPGSISPFGRRNITVRQTGKVHQKIGNDSHANAAKHGKNDRKETTVGDWDKLFAGHDQGETALKGATLAFAKANRHDQIVNMLQAYLRQRDAKPWVYSALAISLQKEGATGEQIEACFQSILDRSPDDLGAWVEAAHNLGSAGQKQAAVDLLTKAANKWPTSVNVAQARFGAARAAGAWETMALAADRLISGDWVGQNRTIETEVRTTLMRTQEQLRKQGKVREADRLRRVADQKPQRDIEVAVSWEGEADIDLFVVEPNNLLCCNSTPRTVQGGVMVSDNASSREVYRASQAVSGDYDIMVRPVWGMPTGGIVNVDIIRHGGTPNETRERKTLKVEGKTTALKTKLEAGRRKGPAPLSPDERFVRDDKLAALVPVNPFLNLRKQLKDGVGENKDNTGFGLGQGGRRQGVGNGFRAGGAVAFDPVITVIPNGTTASVQAVVSADRRYVRLTVVPFITEIDSIDNPRTIQIGGTAGGGGGGVGGF